jgi:hypothetical protein
MRGRAGKQLLEIMERKQTNLCVAADVTTCAGVLVLADAIGAHCKRCDACTCLDQRLTRMCRPAHLLPEDARGHVRRLHARLWRRCAAWLQPVTPSS